MITELIVALLVGTLVGILGLLPDATAPAWMTDVDGALATVLESGAGLGAWIPWSTAGTVAMAVFAALGVGLAIKIVRIIASFLTAGGGAAG